MVLPGGQQWDLPGRQRFSQGFRCTPNLPHVVVPGQKAGVVNKLIILILHDNHLCSDVILPTNFCDPGHNGCCKAMKHYPDSSAIPHACMGVLAPDVHPDQVVPMKADDDVSSSCQRAHAHVNVDHAERRKSIYAVCGFKPVSRAVGPRRANSNYVRDSSESHAVGLTNLVQSVKFGRFSKG